MRSWWKSLGLLAGGLASMGGMVSPASAQFPPPGGGMMPTPGMMGPPMMGGGGPPPGMMMGGGGPPPGMLTGSGGPPPGAFGGNPSFNGQPADFPNSAVPSKEPASPFSIKDEGMPNAFTELIDPRPRLPEPYSIVFRSEYLGWWISKAPIRVHTVTSTTNFPFEGGAIGESGTQILVPASDQAIDYNRLNGWRATVGFAIGYLPPIEVTGFDFNRNYTVFQGGSDNATGIFIARPVQITNATLAPGAFLETSDIINVPGVLNGQVSIASRLSLWGIEVNTLFNLLDLRCLKTDLIVGYRHADLYESLEFNNSSGGFAGQVFFGGALQPPGFAVSVEEYFRTRNAFDGGQFGLRSVLAIDRFTLFTDVKLAMGTTNRTLTIDGNSTLIQPGTDRPTQTLPGGLLALPSNSGSSSTREFSIIPEANISLSYQLSQNVRIFGGYNILYWSNVARPGDHVDRLIDARGVPTASIFAPGTGTAPPRPTIATRDFWAHGFNIGFEIGF